MIETHKFARKPFHVDAVQVTAVNMEDVAGWCQGEIVSNVTEKYIKVEVNRPLNDRQTKAFVGDWVLSAGTGFKVYTNKAFRNSFEQVSGESIMHHSERVRTNVFEPVRVPGEPSEREVPKATGDVKQPFAVPTPPPATDPAQVRVEDAALES